jgi:cysteine-rich repeat protein
VLPRPSALLAALAACSLLVAACLEKQATPCGRGICAADKACDLVHHECVPPEQLESCREQSDGAACSYPGTPHGACREGRCLPAGCGNGVVETGEKCDDGNTFSNDHCSADCHSDESCGNGILDSVAGETCDTAREADRGLCRPGCVTVRCGDGTIDPELNEQCDEGDGNAFAPDACRPTCQLPRCGDGVTDGDEVCDDRNTLSGDGCSADCRSAEQCGDGRLDRPVGEDCDDGNLLSHDGCSSSCRIERPRWRVVPETGENYTPGYPLGMAYDASRDCILYMAVTEFRQLHRGAWNSHLDLRNAPISYAGHRMVWQAASDRVLLFGGLETSLTAGDPTDPRLVLDETWEWDGGRWERLHPQHAPSARSHFAAAYDAQRARTVLFGGTDGTDDLGDTWEWDGTDWANIAATPSPPSGQHAMTYDAGRGAVVLFDGADLWTLAAASWQRLPVVAPLPESEPGATSLAYDGAQNRLVLFRAGRTFAFEGDAWRDLEAEAPAMPVPASAAQLIFDTVAGQIWLFAGYGGPVGVSAVLANDTWQEVGESSSSLPDLSRPEMAYDPLRGTTLLFGSSNGSSPTETYLWDGTWVGFETEHTPPARSQHALAYDGTRDRMLLFGGGNAGGPLNDTWSFDGIDWEELHPREAPSARSSHAMVTDAQGRVVLYGGSGVAASGPDDLWRWQDGEWHALGDHQGPGSRSQHEMAYDRVRQRVVLFGSFDETRTDTWEWDGTSWLQAAIDGPGIRDGHGLAYDANRRQVHLFGGFYDDGIDWEWSGPLGASAAERGWSKLTADADFGSTPTYVNMVYEAVHERLLATAANVNGTFYEFAWASEGAPEEACSFGFDTDHDGLAGCADPDCWGYCTPLCPPGATCAPDLPRCGDGECNDALETFRMCPADCPRLPAVCGDFLCDPGETAASCPGDCHS